MAVSKYYDVAAVIQVIGCIFNNPSLLELEDKYIITDLDFADDFHKTVFGSIYKLHELGAKEITLNSLEDFFSSRPKWKAIYEVGNGDKWIINAAGNANFLTFDYYYNRLKKMSLLRGYEAYGIDVSFLYDVDNILDSNKKQVQEEWLDNASLIDIMNEVDRKIDEIRLTYIDDEFEEASQAGEGIEALIDKFKESPEVGVPLYGPLINTVTRGARLKKFYLRSAATGVGKAIPNYTLIPTPNGMRRVGEIEVGDYLFGQDGKPTKILAKYPQPEEKEIWKVTFSDGRVAECCGEHLWEYRYETHRGYDYRVEDIQTIYNRSLELKNGLKNSDGRGYRFHIKLNEAVEYPEKKYKLPPYVFGAFLGDGSFRYHETNKSLNFSSENEEIPNLICKELGDNFITKKGSHFNYNWTFRTDDNPHHPIWVEEFLSDYPELWNVKSELKYIPNEYMFGSIKQRKELLAGLLDTDGSIDSKGRIGYTTNSKLLRDNVVELCRGLGYVANYLVDQRKEKYTTGECYTIHIQCKKSEKPSLFRLPRKKEIAINYSNSNKREEYKSHLAIVNIEKTSSKTDMTCFTVDNESHLFLMNDYIVTHNTRSMIADACNIACNKIYDETFGWISNGTSEPTLFIATEQDLSEVQTMMLAFLSNVNEDHILYGRYDGDEEDRVREAAKVLKNSPLYVETIADFSLQDIENKIKKNIRDNEVKYVFFDYIHTSMKILEEITRRSGGVKLREDNILFMLSNKLKDLCNIYGIFIMSATQLNGDFKDSDTPDQTLLRGAKAIADKIDYGSILLTVTQKDIDSLGKVLNNEVFVKPTIKLSVYKNRRGRYKGIYLWCKADLGTCRIEPMFATSYGYELLKMEDIKIEIEPAAWEK